MASDLTNIAIWVVTPKGINLARRIIHHWAGPNPPSVFASERLETDDTGKPVIHHFNSLSEAVKTQFHLFQGHIFIMATGIVVRLIAPLIQHKTLDPAVLVMDDHGQHVISLLSGHIGGANKLCLSVSHLTGARPVITTATDVNQKPAIDDIAVNLNLKIENPDKIKHINMAILLDHPICLYDPFAIFSDQLAGSRLEYVYDPSICDIYVGDETKEICPSALVLRPRSLSVGIGCNRGTPKQDIESLLTRVFAFHNLSMDSIFRFASIDIKADETGILNLSKERNIPVTFYNKDQLNQITTQITPSSMAEKYTGAKSVCEAAAILATEKGELLIPKQKTKDVTLAVARRKIN